MKYFDRDRVVALQPHALYALDFEFMCDGKDRIRPRGILTEQHHWQQLQPILQRGRSGPLFSKVLKLNGRAPETGFDNWYIQGGYGNKAQPGEPSIRDAATELLKPEIEKLIAEIEH